MKCFWEYSLRLVRQWIIILVFLPSLLAAIFTYIGIPLILPGWVCILVAIVGMYFAGFRAYRQIWRPLPDLELSKRRSSFGGGGYTSGMPNLPLSFRIFLELKKIGDQLCRLQSISVSKLDVGTDLLGDWQMPTFKDNNRKDVTFPYSIAAGDQFLKLTCMIQVRLCETEPIKFAKRLKELQKYSIELVYTYEDLRGKTGQKTLLISGTFDCFRDNLIKYWKETGMHKLAVCAREKNQADDKKVKETQ